MKSIYIVLTKTETALSRIIGVVTNEPYTHSSISLDSSLTKLYTFSRLQPEKPLPAGFVVENPCTGYMGLHPDTACEVYELKVPTVSYNLIKKKILRMSKQAESYHYSLLGTLYCMFSIKHKRPNHYFCSQFIGELLHESGAVRLPKHESLMHPMDYSYMSECRLLYHGNIYGLVNYYLHKLNPETTVSTSFPHNIKNQRRISIRIPFRRLA